MAGQELVPRASAHRGFHLATAKTEIVGKETPLYLNRQEEREVGL